MSDVVVAPNQRDLAELAAALQAWLQERLPDADGVAVSDFNYPRGAGQSHETILFQADWHADGQAVSEGMVARIKPTDFVIYADTLFTEQYRVMATIAELGTLPIARPLWLEENAGILGAPFFVMERVVGRVPVSVPPYARSGWVAEATPAQRRTMWDDGVRKLAAIQLLPRDRFGFLAGTGDARDGLEQEFDKFSRLAAQLQTERPVPVLDAAIARLRDRWPDNQPPGLVWGDARIGNMMFNDDFKIVAVMDWEQPSLGGALNDLAWWVVNSGLMHGATADRPHLAGMGSREETIALWHEVTGIPTDELDWYEDFTRLKMSCLGVRMANLRGAPLPDAAELARRLKVA